MRQRLEQLGMLDPSAAAFQRRFKHLPAEQAVKQSPLLLRDARLHSPCSDRVPRSFLLTSYQSFSQFSLMISALSGVLWPLKRFRCGSAHRSSR